MSRFEFYGAGLLYKIIKFKYHLRRHKENLMSVNKAVLSVILLLLQISAAVAGFAMFFMGLLGWAPSWVHEILDFIWSPREVFWPLAALSMSGMGVMLLGLLTIPINPLAHEN